MVRMETWQKYADLLREPDKVKEESEVCRENRAEDKCTCGPRELCQLALAKALNVKEPAVNYFAEKARALGLVRRRNGVSRRRPYKFVSLAKGDSRETPESGGKGAPF